MISSTSLEKGDRRAKTTISFAPPPLDRIHACWIGPAIERYVTWLAEREYAARNVFFRVPVLVQFGEFARASGATKWDQLPSYVDPFVHYWQIEHAAVGRSQSEILRSARPIR